MIATTVLGALLSPKPKFNAPQPSALGDFRLPTADAGRAIPVICGTVKISGGNTTWWGDLRVDPIRQKMKTGLFSSTWITKGYRYFLGIQFALCHGKIDSLIGIQAGDPQNAKDVPYTTSGSDPLTVTINAPSLFGGDESEGGITGTIALYRGTQTQPSDAYLSRVQGRTSPTYKGICYASLQQLYLGTSSYMKGISFIVARFPNPFGDGTKTNISGDGNPALFVYELLTNPIFGLGRPSSSIDAASFQAARDTLYSEGLGISMQIDTPGDADALIGEICRHMDGVVYTDPQTGLWTLKLARADYNPATIPTLSPDQVIGTPDFSRGSWSETTNQISIGFTNRSAGYKDDVSIPVQDLGNIAVTNEVRADKIDFRGISNPTTAALVSMRVLKTVAYPISKLKIETNRSAWNYRPGGVFKFTWTPLGITNQIFRVARIAYGSLDDSKITIEAVEDIFGIVKSGFVAPSSGWVNPVGAAQPLKAQKLVEVPYHFSKDGIRAMALAVRGDSTSTAFEIWTNESGGYVQQNTAIAFCPSGILASAYGMRTSATDATGFTLQANSVDLSRLTSTDAAGLANGLNLAMFDTGEIISWQTVTTNADGTVKISGVLRGILDSAPADHAIGERVWFITDGVDLVRNDVYPSDQTITAKLLPKNTLGTLPIGSASSTAITTASRYAKPYPPGDLRQTGGTMANFPNTIVGSADFSASWRDRDRIAQTSAGTVIAQDNTTAYTREGNYTVNVKIGGVVKRTTTALAATTFSYSLANRLADDADGRKSIEIEVVPVNGALSGNARKTPAFVWTGFGLAFGSSFGGLNS